MHFSSLQTKQSPGRGLQLALPGGRTPPGLGAAPAEPVLSGLRPGWPEPRKEQRVAALVMLRALGWARAPASCSSQKGSGQVGGRWRPAVQALEG